MFGCLCVMWCAAWISSFLFLSVALFVRASCSQGVCADASLRLHFTHQDGSLLFRKQTMTCTFPLSSHWKALCLWDQMGSFVRRVSSKLKRSENLLVVLGTEFQPRPDSFKAKSCLLMSCWKWCITSPCSLVWIGCITLDKYWWVLSWGISFEVVKGCSIFFSPPADVLAAWLHTERAQQRTGKKWNSSSSYDIISWHLLLGTQEKGLCVWGGW